MTEPAAQLATPAPTRTDLVPPDLIAECYAKSQGQALAVSSHRFAEILNEIVRKYLPQGPSPQDIRNLCESLRVEELALARACADGSERAWEIFMTRYREKLYDLAGYIAKESSGARELADSLYADLYGTPNREGRRVSKLSSYTGRGSLEGWLRTVMAQEFINRYRKQKKMVSLDEESEEGVQFAAATQDRVVEADPRIASATDRVLKALPAEDRFVLAAYFLDDRTLAEISRMLSVHESTISRKLDKLCKTLRKSILAELVKQGMSRRQASEALDVDVRDLQVNVRRSLAQETATGTFPKRKAEAPAGDGSG